ASVVGRAIGLDGQNYTVIGVLPPGLNSPLDKELFVSLALNASDLSDYDAQFLRLIARLKPGVTRPQANAEVATIVSLWQNGVTPSNTRADAILPKGHVLLGSPPKSRAVRHCPIAVYTASG
ncbi:MAG TPA: ABC transporter permease, partial [Blastocatellia bacterium]|nr:ABC transporter permease [Blastocatellia bacterium]